MSIVDIVSLGTALLTVGYLVYALLFPERF
jgi:K+-transporting ATPase KdpF subunit